MLDNWLKRIQFCLLPAHCVLCGARGDGYLDLCPACLGDLPRNTPACYRCGHRLHGPDGHDRVCGRCLREAPPFDATVAPFRYEAPLHWLIQDLKFRGHLHLARLLGELLAQHCAASQRPVPELLLPMPLHRSRLRERGFNQASELARVVGRSLSIPVDLGSCRRVRATAPQSTLPATERARNLAGAFRLDKRVDARHIALVDDVMTTGHSAAALARTLRSGGVETVQVWVLARASRGKLDTT